MTAPGRCRACGYNLELLPARDRWGKFSGWTADGRCISPDCVLAYAVQPWSKGAEERMADLAEAVRVAAWGLTTTAD